jgi:hypothetical protein
MGSRFGTECGDPNWDPDTDINGDCVLNILDLSITGGNFMDSCPVPWAATQALQRMVVSTAQVALEPPTLDLVPGNTGVMTIAVTGAAGVYGAEAHLSFDPAVVEVVDADGGRPGVQIALGDLLSPDFVATNAVDNAAGTIDIALTQLAPTPPSDGEGALAVITFQAVATGTSPISFSDLILADSDGGQMPAEVQGGTVNVSGDRYRIYLPVVVRSWGP